MDDTCEFRFRIKEQVFKTFERRREAIINALTENAEELCRQCDEFVIPENEYLGLYAFADGTWQVELSGDVIMDLPHSKLYKLPHQEEDKTKWLAKVAADSDIWLLTLTFTLCGFYCYREDWRKWLFNQINELPTIYEVVTSNDKNQEVATEKAKKRVKDKSTVSCHCKALSNSEVQGMSSSSLVSTCKVLNSAKVIGDIGYKQIKDLKREGKKGITKREPPMRSAMQTRSKALGIQTRAQTGKSQIKKIS